MASITSLCVTCRLFFKIQTTMHWIGNLSPTLRLERRGQPLILEIKIINDVVKTIDLCVNQGNKLTMFASFAVVVCTGA